MLVIRLQRTGRKGHAQFRIVAQDSRRTPTSGAIVAKLGHYNPHNKEVVIDKDKVNFYLEHGAQPSDRVVSLLQKEGIKLPSWVKLPTNKSRTIRNSDKLRKNQPKEVVEAPEPVEAQAEPAPETEAETVEVAEEAAAPAEPTESAE